MKEEIRYFFIAAQGDSRFASMAFQTIDFFNERKVVEELNTIHRANWIIINYIEMTKKEFDIYNKK